MKHFLILDLDQLSHYLTSVPGNKSIQVIDGGLKIPLPKKLIEVKATIQNLAKGKTYRLKSKDLCIQFFPSENGKDYFRSKTSKEIRAEYKK